MKKNIISLFTLLCGFAAVSCNNDAVENTAPADENTEKWTLGVGMGTRAAIGSSSEGFRPINWQEDDELTVFNADTEALFTLSEGDSTTQGLFESDSEEIQNSTDYYAVHTRVTTAFSTDDGLTVTMPSPMVMSGTPDEFVSDNLVLVSDKFSFTNKSADAVMMSMRNAVLELHLKLASGDDKTISSLEMEAPVANYFVASATFDGAGDVDYTTAGKLVVSFTTPLTLSAATETTLKLVVWMNPAVVAGDVTGKNFVFNFLDADDNKSLVLNKPAVLLEGGKYYNAPSQAPSRRRVVFVKTDGTGDGSSWDKAMSETDVTTALKALNTTAVAEIPSNAVLFPGDTICLAAGTYTLNGSWTNAETRIVKSLTILGGFPANMAGDEVEITYPSEHRSIISGDRNSDGEPNTGDVRALSVRNSGTEVILKGIDIMGGYVSDWPGAGMSVESGATAELHYCKIYDNFAETGTHGEGRGGGGGVCVKQSSKLYCYNTEISNNKTNNRGGGVDVDEKGVMELYDCKVSGNVSNMTNQGGGGFLVKGGGILYAKDTEISGNKSATRGGAFQIADNDSEVYLESCLISGNETAYFGSAFHVYGHKCNLYVANSTIAANSVTAASSGTINLSEGGDNTNPRVFISCTIAGNITGNNDEGIEFRCENNDLKLINCVVTNSDENKHSLFIKGSKSMTSGGYNVFGKTSGTINPATAADYTGVMYSGFFGANTLADNGGSLKSIMPTGTQAGAPVADLQAYFTANAVDPKYTFDLTKDQRGTARNATAATPGACEKQ